MQIVSNFFSSFGNRFKIFSIFVKLKQRMKFFKLGVLIILATILPCGFLVLGVFIYQEFKKLKTE